MSSCQIVVDVVFIRRRWRTRKAVTWWRGFTTGHTRYLKPSHTALLLLSSYGRAPRRAMYVRLYATEITLAANGKRCIRQSTWQTDVCNNPFYLYSREHTVPVTANGATRFCRHQYYWLPTRDEIHQSIHHGNNGWVRKDQKGNPNDENNSDRSHHHFHQGLVIKLLVNRPCSSRKSVLNSHISSFRWCAWSRKWNR